VYWTRNATPSRVLHISTTVLEAPSIILEHYSHTNDANLNIHGVLMMNDNDIKGQ